jgi:ABC-type bacteriocin/lantibiotic exporter with double-glycine peptidase domain
MNKLFTQGEVVRIAITYTLLVVETLCNLALPALIGLAIDGIIRGRYLELYGLVFGIIVLIASGSFRKSYDTRNFGRIQTRLALLISTQEIAVTQRIARVRLLDDLGQFFDTYLPQAIAGLITTIGAVVVLFVYDLQIAMASVGTVTVILLFTTYLSKRTTKLNSRINSRLEKEASILQHQRDGALFKHMEVLRRLRNYRSDAETAMFAGGWMAITGLIIFSIVLLSKSGVTSGQIFAILSYVLAIAEGFSVLPPMLEHLTRTRDIVRRFQMS